MHDFAIGFCIAAFGIGFGAVLQTLVIFKFYSLTRKYTPLPCPPMTGEDE
jgi:hypothetical protein